MAESEMMKSQNELEKEITCAVCQEHYVEPKLLPCHHYFCKQCIKRLVLKTGPGKAFSCPECRQEVSLEKDVEELQSAFFINRLKPTIEKIHELFSVNGCSFEICREHNQKLKNFCFDCSLLLCSECVVKKHMNHNVKICDDVIDCIKEDLDRKIKSLEQVGVDLKIAIGDI